MSQSKKSPRYEKPYPDFPLTPHKRGWCKKINGKVVVICGHVPPHEALEIFQQKTPALYAKPKPSVVVAVDVGAPPVATPTPATTSPTVSQIKDKYLATKGRELATGSLADRSYSSILEIVEPFATAVSKRVIDLRPTDFAEYRHILAAKFSPNALDRHITMIRAMFNWALKNELIDRLPRWGDCFERPTAAMKRRYRQEKAAKHGKRQFTPKQVRKLIRLAKQPMRAMILLGRFRSTSRTAKPLRRLGRRFRPPESRNRRV